MRPTAEPPRLTADDRRFVAEVRAFLVDHWPPQVRVAQQRADDVRDGLRPAVRAWFDALASRAWSVPHWPVAHGGTGWSVVQHYLHARELALAEAPSMDTTGVDWAGPAICVWGDATQQQRFLPGIR